MNPSDIKILVACEYSGIIRNAFASKGFDAMSCDILPTESEGKHYQGDVFDILHNGFDVLIAHPPCTYLSSAGLHFCNIEIHGPKAIDRIKQRHKATEFFLDLYNAPIKFICIENPIGFISSSIIPPTQIIHPYYFGEAEMKRTALWLRNLPPLQYSLTKSLFDSQTASPKPEPYQIQIQKSTGKLKRRYFTDALINNKLKSPKEKSKSFQSIANAMANQWTPIILNKSTK